VAAEGNTGRDVIASPTRAQRGRRPSACTETPRAGTGISRGSSRTNGTVERVGKAGGRTPAMYGHGKSDGHIVPEKSSNNGEAEVSPAEKMEGRRPTKGNAPQTAAHRTLSRVRASTGLRGVREAAR